VPSIVYIMIGRVIHLTLNSCEVGTQITFLAKATEDMIAIPL
jgi:hypothetical protein